MDVIAFFRSIDGIPYYVLLVVNTILIFAIIGYLGEKNNQKIIKIGLSTPTPNNGGAMDFSAPVTPAHNNIEMPTVAPTVVSSNLQDTGIYSNNHNISANNEEPAMPIAVNQNPNVNGPVGMVNTTQNIIPNSASQPQINNEIDQNEKVPAVLVINSQNTNMPK